MHHQVLTSASNANRWNVERLKQSQRCEHLKTVV